MKRDIVFADTNIILDWLGRRPPFFRYAEQLFLKAEQGEVRLLISTMSYISTEYILRKQLGREKALRALTGIRAISSVCSSGQKEVDLALVSGFRDFEDAFQYFTALNNGAKAIITRNEKDFKGADIPVMSAEAYVRLEDG